MQPHSGRRRAPMLLAAAAALALAGYAGYRLGAASPPPPAAASATADPLAWSIAEGEAATRRHLREGLRAGQVDPVTGRAILYYHDPMVPGRRFDAPGKSPFMDMLLVPVYAGSERDSGTVAISPRLQQNLGMRTAPVASRGEPPRLFVPTEAVMPTGRRTLVIVAEGGGHFRPVQVETGSEADAETEIRRGLAAGQQVVVSGQFLVDSEASLRGVEARMLPAAPALHQTPARVDALAGDIVTLTHPPIPALKWPEMKMDFRLPPPAQRPPRLAAGDAVEIEFHLQEGSEPQIATLRRRAASEPRR